MDMKPVIKSIILMRVRDIIGWDDTEAKEMIAF